MLPQQPLITGRRHMVVAGHYLATEAGLKILEAGGNAVDAGVAAGIALGVLHSDQVQFSGVAPMLIYIKKLNKVISCLLYTSPSPREDLLSRMPSSA